MVGLSCKKKDVPALLTEYNNLLTVEGPILSGDSTIIRLSRTTRLTDGTTVKAELNAIVAVENDQNQLYPLTEKGGGSYVLGVTNFGITRKYRLNIKTADSKVYQSDFVIMKITPAIDSVYYKPESEKKINFFVNAHDAAKNTRYYRWDYKETWSYTSLHQAFWQYKNGIISAIAPFSNDDVFGCFRTAKSNQVVVASSADDVISNQAIGSLPAETEKISRVYVMQLRQYALTEAGYSYYNTLQSTQNTASASDQLSSSTKGNIHCVTVPAEPVSGFVSVSTVSNKQLNVRGSETGLRRPDPYGTINWGTTALNPHYYASYYFPGPTIDECAPNSFFVAPSITLTDRVNQFIASGDNLLIDHDRNRPSGDAFAVPVFPDAQQGVNYQFYFAPKRCVDCRFKGGTNIRPSYFPAQYY
jgi:hypothetical protein